MAGIHYDFDHLEMVYADEETDATFLVVRFLYPVAHRVLNESYRLKLLSEFSPLPLLVVVELSDFLQWIQLESFDAWNLGDVRHFIVSDSEWIVDVLAQGDPELIWHDVE